MRRRQAEKITDGLWRLGGEESCIYLLEGEKESMVVSGGMSYLVPALLEQLKRFGIDEGRITKLLILHAHFDHIGTVPFFKRRHPNLEVYASARGWEIVHLPKAIATINAFGREVAARMDMERVYNDYDIEWRDDITGKTVTDGCLLGVEPFEGIIYETPGHSSCSISFYVPALKALFPSDGGGIPYKDTILVAANSNFTKYQKSLEKLEGLDVEFLCGDHYACVTGREARNYIRNSIEEARKHRSELEEAYLETGDLETAAQTMVERFYRENPDYFLTQEIFKNIFRQMLRHLIGEMKRANGRK